MYNQYKIYVANLTIVYTFFNTLQTQLNALISLSSSNHDIICGLLYRYNSQQYLGKSVDGENVLSLPSGILSLSNQIGILKKVYKNES